MAAGTEISWAHDTFNPWEGCTRLSPACDHCFAAERAHRFGNDHLWAGDLRRTSKANWREPLKWDREAAAAGQPRRVFCASLCDVFDNQAPQEWRDDLWKLIEATPHLTWMLLTKRPQNVPKMLPSRWRTLAGEGCVIRGAPRNIWLGTTAEDQERADQRIAIVMRLGYILGWLPFVSYEPALGPIDFTRVAIPGTQPGRINALNGKILYYPLFATRGKTLIDTNDGYAPIELVIAGGESGPPRLPIRPSHPDWFRSARDQCATYGATFHLKQWGEFLPEGQFDSTGFQWAPGNDDPKVHWWLKVEPTGPLPVDSCSIRIGTKLSGRLLDRVLHDAMPPADRHAPTPGGAAA